MIESSLKNIKPIIFSLPHSGYGYDKNFLRSTTLEMHELRKSEDIYVDEIYTKSIRLGFSYLKALFPRLYIDVNRHPLELDPSMFSFKIKNKYMDVLKINSGIGLISKCSVHGNNIYFDLLSKKDLRNRLLKYYFPYHNILKHLIKNLKINYNNILICDCHSMPSSALINKDVDIVLGNNMDNSISKNLFIQIKTIFIKHGFKVEVNKPYSGGFITQYYGNPNNGINVIQIELNKSKYIDEYSLKRNIEKMQKISFKIENIIKEINEILIKD